MKTNGGPDWHIPQRQAYAGLIIIIFKAFVTVIKAIWPIVLLVIFRERNKTFDAFEMLLIGIPALILIRSLIDFFYFRFYIQNEDLIIQRGFLSKKVITIPLAKIHSVHIEQNLLHQFLDVAKLSIDTAGSEKSEAEIDAISIHKAESFRQFLLQNESILSKHKDYIIPEPEVPVIKLKGADLLKLGLSANHLRAFLIVFAFGVSMLQNLEEIFGNRVIVLVQQSSAAIGFSVASVVVLIVIVLLISVLVSMIRIFLKYSNFQCNETDHGFRIQTGLINSRQNLVPFSKIQYISWEANWIRRKIGLFMLEFHQAQNEHAKRKQRIRLPMTKREHVERLLLSYHPDVQSLPHSSYGINSRYPVHRMLVAGFPFSIVGALLSFFWIQEYALLFFLFIPYVFFKTRIYQRRFRLYISAEAFQVNSGAWGKQSKIAQWYKIQYMQLRQSIYQRRKELATVIIHTAGGKITIPFIDLQLACAIKNYGLYKVESSGKSWM